MAEQDRYQYPNFKKRYVNIPEGLSGEHHGKMRMEAENLSFFLRNYMKLGGLLSHSMSRTYDDGSRLFISSFNGLDTISYTGPTKVSEEEEERPSTVVKAHYVMSSHKIYYDIMGNPEGKFFIDLSDSGIAGSHAKWGFGMNVLEHDAMYGILFFVDNDDSIFVDYYKAEGMHFHVIMWHVASDAKTSEIDSGYPKARDVEYRAFEAPIVATSYATRILSNWSPPPYPPVVVGPYFFDFNPRGVYCYMSGGLKGRRSLSNLVGECCIEISYYYAYGSLARGIGVYNTDSNVWRTIDYNGNRVPADPYYLPHTFEAYVTTPGNNPKWSIVNGGPDYVDPTHLRTRGYLCLNEEYGSSIELTDFDVTYGYPSQIGLLGPGYPLQGASPGGFMPGSGDGIGRISFRVGKYHPPYGSPPDYICSVSNKKEFVINGSYYAEGTTLPIGTLLPSGLGRVGREMWEAKEFFGIRNQGANLRIPTVDGGGSYTWGYPTANLNTSVEARHPDFPGETLLGGSIQHETFYLYDMDWGVYVCSAFGCIHQRR